MAICWRSSTHHLSFHDLMMPLAGGFGVVVVVVAIVRWWLWRLHQHTLSVAAWNARGRYQLRTAGAQHRLWCARRAIRRWCRFGRVNPPRGHSEPTRRLMSTRNAPATASCHKAKETRLRARALCASMCVYVRASALGRACDHPVARSPGRRGVLARAHRRVHRDRATTFTRERAHLRAS